MNKKINTLLWRIHPNRQPDVWLRRKIIAKVREATPYHGTWIHDYIQTGKP